MRAGRGQVNEKSWFPLFTKLVQKIIVSSYSNKVYDVKLSKDEIYHTFGDLGGEKNLQELRAHLSKTDSSE